MGNSSDPTPGTVRYQDPAWQRSMALKLDFNDMLEERIGLQAGLSPAQVSGLQTRIHQVHRQITERSGLGGDFFGFMDLPYQGPEALAEIRRTADRLACLGDRHVLIGIGGSYLGARALIETLSPPTRGEGPGESARPRISYAGFTLDPETIQAILSRLPDRDEGGFTVNVVSKSGATLEMLVAFRIFRQRLQQLYGREHAQRIVATTDPHQGLLRAIAEKEGYQTLAVPSDVVGRYSVLSPVGLLPAAVAGIEIAELIAGARYMAERCQDPALEVNPAYLYAVLQSLSYQANRTVSLMTGWSQSLAHFVLWYSQLCAESLGKDNKGRIPVEMINTRDLHSRGQEVQQGPRNMVVTNLLVESSEVDLMIPWLEDDLEQLNYLAGKGLSGMGIQALEGTAYAYAKAGRPSMNLRIPQLNAFTLGQMIYMFELATVAEAYLMGVNPLNQPGVEEYKKYMYANLGHPAMAQYKAELQAARGASDRFVV